MVAIQLIVQLGVRLEIGLLLVDPDRRLRLEIRDTLGSFCCPCLTNGLPLVASLLFLQFIPLDA